MATRRIPPRYKGPYIGYRLEWYRKQKHIQNTHTLLASNNCKILIIYSHMINQIGGTSLNTGTYIQNVGWISPALQYLASQEHLLGRSIHAVKQSQHWRPWGCEPKIAPKYLGQAPEAGLGASWWFATHGLPYFPNPSPTLALVTCMPKQPINNLLGHQIALLNVIPSTIIFCRYNIPHSLCTQNEELDTEWPTCVRRKKMGLPLEACWELLLLSPIVGEAFQSLQCARWASKSAHHVLNPS